MAACTELQAALPEAETPDVVVASASGSYKLLAGQDIEVGEVSVTIEDNALCVSYAVTPPAFADGWRIHETHLFIGADRSGIPVNRNGNPVPGQFPYGEVDLGGVVSWQHCVDPAAFEDAETLVIAAHAAIERHEPFVPMLAWSRSLESSVASSSGYGAQWELDHGFGIQLDADQTVWDNGTVTTRVNKYPSISYASWDHESAAGNVDLRRFQATFELPTGYRVHGAKIASAIEGHGDKIPINDNVYVFLNEALQFWGGTIMGEGLVTYDKVFLGMPGVGVDRTPSGGDDFGTDGWFIWCSQLPPISLTSFNVGSNVLDVFAEEFRDWGGMTELALTLDVGVATESAWGDGDRIAASGNWGTYFEYVLTDGTPD